MSGKVLRFQRRADHRLRRVADDSQPHCTPETVDAVLDVLALLDELSPPIQQQWLETLRRLCDSAEAQRLLFERIRIVNAGPE